MSFFSVIASSKLAASAIAVSAITLGGAGTAAFANALPTPAQQAAHDLIGAPSPNVSSTAANGAATAQKAAGQAASAAPSAPALPSAPAAGLPSTPNLSAANITDLCQTFVHGGLTSGSTDLKNLSVLAHGDANVSSYCATELQSGAAAGSAQGGANVSANADGSVTLPSTPAVPAVPALPSTPSLPSAPALPGAASGLASQATNAVQP
ncbi:hypothetical protein [Sinomonas albida]|uniref:hypothetical protein n=1 Tax=Sinomonas albida TaxID=369942 RepID=UPI0010A7FC66|nr:hypothetical protein [Sinomonas albida]